MEFLSIQNFRFGLDTRKGDLTSQPGALARCDNAHINAGGEVEKRLAFVLLALSNVLKPDGSGNYEFGSMPAGTFGLEATDQGLVTFGSADAPVSYLPAQVSYQQLVGPGGHWDAEHVEWYPDQMLGVVMSENYNGKAFVIATFVSGTYAFYDGQIIPSSRGGTVLNGGPAYPGVPLVGQPETLDQLAADMAAQINDIDGWFATSSTDGSGTVTIDSPQGVDFTPTSIVHSSNGQITQVQGQSNVVGTAPEPSSTAFNIVSVEINKGTTPSGPTVSFELYAPTAADGTGVLPISGAVQQTDASTSAQATGSSAAATAQAIVNSVNSNATAKKYGYQAILVGQAVQILCAFPFVKAQKINLQVDIQWLGTTAPTKVSLASYIVSKSQITISLAPAPVAVHMATVGNSLVATVSTPPNQASAVPRIYGGTPPYTYNWEEANPNNTTPVSTPSGIKAWGPLMSHTADPNIVGDKEIMQNYQGPPFIPIRWNANVPKGQQIVGYWKLTLTDNGSPKISTYIHFAIILSYGI